MEKLEPLKSGLENDQVDSQKTEFLKDSETEHSPKSKWEYSSEWDDETLSRLASEFPHVEGLTYLDHAASTLYSKSQVDAVSRELTSTLVANPHSGGRSSELVAETRSSVLGFLGASSDEYTLVFTAGATASLRLVGECWPWRGGNHRQGSDTRNKNSESDASSISAGGGEEVLENHNITSNSSSIINSINNNKNTHNNRSMSFVGEGRGLILHSESHTSAVGLRELARAAGVPVQVRDDQGLVELLEGQEDLSGWLLCYPAMSNFNGRKLPLSWVERAQSRGAKVLLDTAALLSTCPLDLTRVQPDFLVLSFYKLFGLPTGLGALLVRRTVAGKMTKQYFGGGTVDMHLVHQPSHVSRVDLASRLEDGTGHFLGVAALRHGLRTLKALPGGMEAVSRHTFGLARLTFNSLSVLRHHNGNPVVKIHSEDSYTDIKTQGGMVNFTLLDSAGEVVGHSTFARIAALEGVHVRTGCFCNTGGCQRWLGMLDEDTVALHKAGHVCGDGVDLVDGRPTGSVRVSFGYMTTKREVDTLVNLIKMHFVEATPTVVQEKTIAAKADLRPKVKTEASNVVLESIVVYPVKSCRGMQVVEWPLGEAGLR